MFSIHLPAFPLLFIQGCSSPIWVNPLSTHSSALPQTDRYAPPHRGITDNMRVSIYQGDTASTLTQFHIHTCCKHTQCLSHIQSYTNILPRLYVSGKFAQIIRTPVSELRATDPTKHTQSPSRVALCGYTYREYKKDRHQLGAESAAAQCVQLLLIYRHYRSPCTVEVSVLNNDPHLYDNANVVCPFQNA